MLNYSEVERKLQQILQSRCRPVAVTFAAEAPEGVAKFEGSEPSSCSYWRLAAEGRSFYTVAKDHQNCPIGGYTHNLLQPETMPQLNQTLTLMSEIGYIRMEEIPGVFQLKESPRAVVYSPLGEARMAPSVVVALGRPGRVMMLAEAAPAGGRVEQPAAIGAAYVHGVAGDAGERRGDQRGLHWEPGVHGARGRRTLRDASRHATWKRIVAEIDTMMSANETLRAYHDERRVALRK